MWDTVCIENGFFFSFSLYLSKRLNKQVCRRMLMVVTDHGLVTTDVVPTFMLLAVTPVAT